MSSAMALTRPASLVLVHGAGSGPWVYRDWPEAFPGIAAIAVDLQQGLDVAQAGHEDYARAVTDAARRLPTPAALCGWSMGGLIALQAAQRIKPHSVILLEASPPAEVQGFSPETEIGDGAFEPEAVYGSFPDGMPARLESARARAERKRGISIPSLPCPSLVVYGDSFPDERGAALAQLYQSDELSFPGLDHWDLVLEPRVRTAVANWLGLKRNDQPRACASTG
jgi:pimeloyl-ACP methyl ester carboxylesterase